MEALFFWWQWMFIVLGLALICVLVELVLVYLILRLQKKPRPLGWPLLNRATDYPVIGSQIFPNIQRAGSAPEIISTTAKKTDEPLHVAQLGGIEPVKSQDYELMREVGDNLTIAAAAVKGKLVSFHSEIMYAHSSRLNALSSQVREDLSEAYKDIRLANTLVWLSRDMGRQSREMESGYLQLCNKISEHLGSAVLGMINSRV
jgi:hypothetical protein